MLSSAGSRLEELWKYIRSIPITPKRIGKLLGLITYVLVGCVFYHRYEGWNFLTCIFFTMVTITTVGYGYQHPTTDEARLFTIFYLVIGVYVVYFYIGKELSKSFDAGMRYVDSITAEDIGVQVAKEERTIIISALVLVLFLLSSGGMFVAINPNISYIEGLYFAVQTSSTVGYGDIDMQSTHAKVFLLFYIIISSLLSAFLFNRVQLLMAERKRLRKLQGRLFGRQDLGFLSTLDNGNGFSESDFILAMLKQAGTINDADILTWKKRFIELDVQNRGRVFASALNLVASDPALASESHPKLETEMATFSPLKPV